jgi:hypothetical protein
MWLYPLPPVLALLGFGYIVVSRPNFGREVALAVGVALLGTVVFGARSLLRTSDGGAEDVL